MNKEVAVVIQKSALQAVECFSGILYAPEFDNCAPEIQDMLKRHIGFLIGETQMRLLEEVNRHFPDLDDLR